MASGVGEVNEKIIGGPGEQKGRLNCFLNMATNENIKNSKFAIQL